jgi:hypothetical protein
VLAERGLAKIESAGRMIEPLFVGGREKAALQHGMKQGFRIYHKN